METLIELARRYRAVIERAVQSIDNETALGAVSLFPQWAAGQTYTVGQRIRYNDVLYSVLQEHTSQSDWTPDITASLYTEICADPEAGTLENPIQYNNNMELILGLYYVQHEVIYLCIRSTEQPVYNDLADLVGIYVEVEI